MRYGALKSIHDVFIHISRIHKMLFHWNNQYHHPLACFHCSRLFVFIFSSAKQLDCPPLGRDIFFSRERLFYLSPKANNNTRYLLFLSFIAIVSYGTDRLVDQLDFRFTSTLVIFFLSSFVLGFLYTIYFVFSRKPKK